MSQRTKTEEKTRINNHAFSRKLTDQGLSINPITVETLQVNITKLCNQACTHCHVDSSPWRTEQMSLESVDRCLEILGENDCIKNLDLTGGAPELNPHFDYFVREARRLGKHVMVRHNLTVTLDGNPGRERKKRTYRGFSPKTASRSYPRFHITAATLRTSREEKGFLKKA